MGVNRASSGILNDDIIREASHQEIIRRYFRCTVEYAMGLVEKDTVDRIKAIMKKAGAKPEDRKVVCPAREAAKDAELKGKGKHVVASGEMWPNHACCSLVVTDKLIKEQPELVEQIIKTHIKATDYINAHPDEAAQIYTKKTNANLTEIEHSIENWDGKWVSDPRVQIPSTVEYAKVDYEMKYTKRELTEKDLFDTSLYERVKGAEKSQ